MFTNETLKTLAVAVVEKYINEGVDLSSGIAATSTEARLNHEQTERLIETVNSLAYLKLLGKAEDRTFEFPVAKPEEVLGKMSTELDKVACYVPTTTGAGMLEKAASVADAGTDSPMSVFSNLGPVQIKKMIASTKASMEKVANDITTTGANVERLVRELRADGAALEKLACAMNDETASAFDLMKGYFPLNVAEVKSGSKIGLYKQASLSVASDLLEEVTKFTSLLKQAKELEKQAGIWEQTAAASNGAINSPVAKESPAARLAKNVAVGATTATRNTAKAVTKGVKATVGTAAGLTGKAVATGAKYGVAKPVAATVKTTAKVALKAAKTGARFPSLVGDALWAASIKPDAKHDVWANLQPKRV